VLNELLWDNVLEIGGIEEIEKVEQFSKVVIERSTGQ
jgi:hypothetical protein